MPPLSRLRRQLPSGRGAGKVPKLLADLDDGLGDALDLAVEEVLDFFESQFVSDER